MTQHSPHTPVQTSGHSVTPSECSEDISATHEELYLPTMRKNLQFPHSLFLHPVQAKMTVGGTQDRYELEADRKAKEIVQTLHSQTSPPSQTTEAESASALNQVNTTSTHSLVQRQTVSTAQTSGSHIASPVESSIRSNTNAGFTLPQHLLAPAEQTLNARLGDVRLHTDAQADMLNRQLHSCAFTTGRDIYFREGAFDPHSRSGQELIFHEATHVVQQTGADGTINRSSHIQRMYDPPLKHQVSKAKTYAMQALWYEAGLKVLAELEVESGLGRSSPLKSFGSTPELAAHLIQGTEDLESGATPKTSLKSYHSASDLLDEPDTRQPVRTGPPPVAPKPLVPPKTLPLSTPLTSQSRPSIPTRFKDSRRSIVRRKTSHTGLTLETASPIGDRPVPRPRPSQKPTPPPKPSSKPTPPPKPTPKLPLSTEPSTPPPVKPKTFARSQTVRGTSDTKKPGPPPPPPRLDSLPGYSPEGQSATATPNPPVPTIKLDTEEEPRKVKIRDPRRQLSVKLNRAPQSRYAIKPKASPTTTPLSPFGTSLTSLPEVEETELPPPVYQRSFSGISTTSGFSTTSGASTESSSDASTPIYAESRKLGVHPKRRTVISPTPTARTGSSGASGGAAPIPLERQMSKSERLFGDFERKLSFLRDPSFGQDLENDPLITGRKELEDLFPKDEPKKIARRIAAAVGMTFDEVWPMLSHAYIRTLNHRDKVSIIHSMDFGTDDSPDVYTSYLIPVNENYHPTYGDEGKAYGHTTLGSILAKHDLEQTEIERATNLGYTALYKGTPGHLEDLVFEAFRSGVSSGKKIKDPELRMHSTESGLTEAFEAMLIRFIQLQSPEDQEKILSGQTSPTVPVSIANLESVVIPSEKKHTDLQDEVLDKLSKGYHQFELVWPLPGGGQRKINLRAKFKVRSYNFGVNAQGTDLLQSNTDSITSLLKDADEYLQTALRLIEAEESPITLLEARLSQWSRPIEGAAPVPQESIDRLQQDIAAKKAKIKYMRTKRLKIQQLRDQVATRQGEARSYKQEAYVANLEFLLGVMFLFHCKSGKDRTGLADVENKHLARAMHKAATLESPQLVPAYEFETESDQDDFLRMLWESGNLEWGAYNTGGQALKIAPTALKPKPISLESDRRFMERVGGPDALKKLHGLKRYTGAAYF